MTHRNYRIFRNKKGVGEKKKKKGCRQRQRKGWKKGRKERWNERRKGRKEERGIEIPCKMHFVSFGRCYI